jgi:ankyrin repeat protein
MSKLDLPARPNLEWLRKTAKQLRASQPQLQLADAQLAVARRYGFASWRKLVAFVGAVDSEGERLRQAVRTGDGATVAAILDATPELVHLGDDIADRDERPSDTRGMTLLHLAVAENQRAMVELLIARGAPLDARNADGRAPLHDAFELARDDIAKLLIAAGAAIDVCMAAAYGMHARLAAMLDADPAQAGDLTTGVPPLGWATYAADTRAVEILLAHGAPLDAHAWDAVCHVGQVAVARLLLAAGADPNVADARGEAPLHRVIASRLVRDPAPLVALLLAAGADPSRTNADGATPLDAAEAQTGAHAETYFPKRQLGEKQLAETIRLLRVSVRR